MAIDRCKECNRTYIVGTEHDPLATHLRPDLDRLEDMDQADEESAACSFEEDFPKVDEESAACSFDKDFPKVDEKIEIKIDRAANIFCKGLLVGLILGSILTGGVFLTHL